MKKLVLLATSIVSLYAISSNEETSRYFGGLSQNEVLLPKSSTYTAPLIVTEEVFAAKNADDIDKVVQKQKQKDIASGKYVKEFLEDRSGHLYGGLSENKLNFEAQTLQ